MCVCYRREHILLVAGGWGSGGGGELLQAGAFQRETWLVQAAHDELCARPSQCWSPRGPFCTLPFRSSVAN